MFAHGITHRSLNNDSNHVFTNCDARSECIPNGGAQCDSDNFADIQPNNPTNSNSNSGANSSANHIAYCWSYISSFGCAQLCGPFYSSQCCTHTVANGASNSIPIGGAQCDPTRL